MLLACNPWSTFERGICFADAVLGLVAWGLHLCFPWRLGKQRGIQCQHCADAGRISYDRKLGMRQFWRLIIKESHQTKPSIIVNITINPITDGNPFKLTLWYQGVLHGRSPRKKKKMGSEMNKALYYPIFIKHGWLITIITPFESIGKFCSIIFPSIPPLSPGISQRIPQEDSASFASAVTGIHSALWFWPGRRENCCTNVPSGI